MIARVRKSMQEKDQGFTLVELLVVIIIIGILSAIAIPVFMNQRKKAVDSGIKSDLRTIANEMETYYIDYQVYAGSAAKNVATIGTATTSTVTVNASDDDTVFTITGGANDFVVTGTNSTKGTGDTYTYDSDAGGLQ